MKIHNRIVFFPGIFDFSFEVIEFSFACQKIHINDWHIIEQQTHTKKTNFAIFLFPSPHYFFAFISFVDKTFDPKNQIKKERMKNIGLNGNRINTTKKKSLN